jgi:hypothetical protein
MPAEFHGELTGRIVTFLRQIGLSVVRASVKGDSFLPGIEVVDGGLVVDESKLKYLGDLLHEAGHLAVTPGTARSSMNGQVETPGVDPNVIESAAMCWSYAACRHLQIDPRIVFHEHGYHGRSESLLLNFELGVFPGVHELVTAGMTSTSVDPAALELPQFPSMRKWLRD